MGDSDIHNQEQLKYFQGLLKHFRVSFTDNITLHITDESGVMFLQIILCELENKAWSIQDEPRVDLSLRLPLSESFVKFEQKLLTPCILPDRISWCPVWNLSEFRFLDMSQRSLLVCAQAFWILESEDSELLNLRWQWTKTGWYLIFLKDPYGHIPGWIMNIKQRLRLNKLFCMVLQCPDRRSYCNESITIYFF